MSQHDETVAAWLKEAAADLTAPTPRERMAAVLKWAARAANVKGAATLADRGLRHQELLDLQCRFRADGMPTDAGEQLVLAKAPSEIEMSRARADYSTAVELLELAERITRLLERPRANSGQSSAKPVPRFAVGGKR